VELALRTQFLGRGKSLDKEVRRMKIKMFLAALALTALAVLMPVNGRAFDFFGLTSYPSLKVTPPRMLYWWAIWSNTPDAHICEKLRTGEIIEADEAAMAKAKTLPCAASYGGDWLRYTVMVTWRCPGNAPGQLCPYAKNTIYGFEEEVPPEALLHMKEDGSRSCTLNGVSKTIIWHAGDPVDILFTEQYVGYPTLCDGYYSRRAQGTHLLVNPAHPWTVEAVKRYATVRRTQGYSFARIDEEYLIDSIPPVQTVEFFGKSDTAYHAAWNSRLKDMRSVSGWKATCPSISDWYRPDAMLLSRAGGCISSEGMFGGGGILPNFGKKTISELRGMYSTRLQNAEAGSEEVPNNIILAMRYESTERNVRSASMATMQARISNSPNLYFLADCADVVGAYGAALQEAIGYGGDRVMCIDHWGAGSDRPTGYVAPWFMNYNHKPTWTQ